MIRFRGNAVRWVMYDLVFDGKVVDTLASGATTMRDLIAKCQRNPGMSVIARVFAADTPDEEERLIESRTVYPVTPIG